MIWTCVFFRRRTKAHIILFFVKDCDLVLNCRGALICGRTGPGLARDVGAEDPGLEALDVTPDVRVGLDEVAVFRELRVGLESGDV